MDEIEETLNDVPGKLENSTLGIWAAGDHIDVLEMVYFLFCLQRSTFFLVSMRMYPAASKSLVRSANSNDGGKLSMLHPSRNQLGSAP